MKEPKAKQGDYAVTGVPSSVLIVSDGLWDGCVSSIGLPVGVILCRVPDKVPYDIDIYCLHISMGH